jgi:hypothetical protein
MPPVATPPRLSSTGAEERMSYPRLNAPNDTGREALKEEKRVSAMRNIWENEKSPLSIPARPAGLSCREPEGAGLAVPEYPAPPGPAPGRRSQEGSVAARLVVAKTSDIATSNRFGIHVSFNNMATEVIKSRYGFNDNRKT